MLPLLRAFSSFSFGRGVLPPEALCRIAKERGVTHLALTDVGGLYGFVDFLRLARAHGLIPIAGATLPLPEGSLTVLAEGRTGYAALCRLVTASHARDPGARGFLRDAPDPDGLVVLADDPRALACAFEWAGPGRVFAAFGWGPPSPELVRCRHRLGLGAVVAPHAYLGTPQDARAHRLVRAVALRTSLDAVPPRELWPGPGLVPGREDALLWRQRWPEAWATTVELAQRCEVDWEFERPLLPRVWASPEEALRLLREAVEEGIARRYPSPPSDLRRRLEREFAAIAARGLADYFLLVRDVLRAAAPSATCGRGSGASSIVAYCLGLTEVDPLAANLYFERFLGPGRADIPDLDIDLPWDERPAALRRVFDSRPRGETCLVATHVTFGRRGAFREVARVMGIPEAQVGALWRQAEHGTGPTLVAPARSLLERLLHDACLLEGLPRHLGRHCGGVVIVPGGVDTVVPYEPLPDGLCVIQWEKDQTEDAGLVKIDLLGNRSLSVVRDATRWVGTPAADPLRDAKTQALLARGDTMGIFYVESPAMRQLQARASTGSFESLVVHSSLIRPAANRWIAEYLRRLHGAPYDPIHPHLESLLAESKGILCYQEDVMRVAVELAGFDHALADQLRRTLSGKRGLPLAELGARFRDGLRARGFSDEHVQTLWAMVESFAGYSFCKAHSASYALLSFRAAYLKAHHPAAFMAAVLTNGGGYYSTQAYVSEARRMGLVIHGPDVNASEVAYTPCEGGIRVGLCQVTCLGTDAAHRIVGARAQGPFLSLEDVFARCDLPLPAAQGLVMAGALDSLHGPGCRAPLLHRLARLGARGPRSEPLLVTPPATWYDAEGSERLSRLQEMEALGFPLRGHPLDVVNAPVSPPHCSLDIPHHVGRRIRLLGWYVTAKPVHTQKGEDMAFISFEDRCALFETVAFPEVYRRVRADLGPNRAYLVEGTVMEDFGVHTVELTRLWALPPLAYPLSHTRPQPCSPRPRLPTTWALGA